MRKDKKLLIVGSLAFDHLMHYEGVFQEKILPSHLHALSVSFGVHGRRVTFGGCGGNIAFHFKKLGGNPLVFGLAGKDFTAYEKWLVKNGVNTSCISKKENEYTSAAFIVTDERGHQITLFDEGAAKEFSPHDLLRLRNTVVEHRQNITAAIIAPTNALLMKTAALMCIELGIPYFFDPGQAIIKFSKNDLRMLCEQAEGLFTNEYEKQLLIKESGFSREKLEKMCPLIIETLGEKGSLVTYQRKRVAIEPVPVKGIVDPTGCGDAYRAGFLFEWLGFEEATTRGSRRGTIDAPSIIKAGFHGSQLGSYVLSIKGTQ